MPKQNTFFGKLINLKNLVGGNPFLITYILANNKLFLIIKNTLTNTETNKYLFISIKFAKRLLKLLGVKQYKIKQFFKITGFNKKSLQIINTVVKAYFIIQKRTIFNKLFIVMDITYNIIISQ